MKRIPKTWLARWWLWLPAALLALLLALVLSIPLIGKAMVVGALEARTGGSVSLEQLRWKPFQGWVELRGLRITPPEGSASEIESVGVDLALSALRSRALVLESAWLRGGTTTVEVPQEGAVRIAGIALEPTDESDPPEAERREPWSLVLQRLRVEDLAIEVAGNGANLRIQVASLEAADLNTTAPETPTRLQADLQLNGAPIQLQVEGTPLARPINAEVSLQVRDLDLPPLLAWIPELPLVLRDGQLDTDLDTRLRIGSEHPDVNVEGQLRLRALRLEAGSDAPTTAGARQLTYTGRAHLRAPEQVPGQQLDLTGVIEVSEAEVQRLDTQLSLAQLLLDAELYAQLNPDAKVPVGALQASGAVKAGALRLVEADQSQLAWRALELSGLRLTGLSDLRLERLRLDGFDGQLVRGPEGNLLLPTAAAPTANQRPQADAPSSTDTEANAGQARPNPVAAPHLVVDRLELTGGAKLALDDRAMTPHTTSTLIIDQLVATDLETGRAGKPMAVELAGSINQAKLSASAEGTLLTRAPTGNLAIQLRHLDLSHFSPYVRSASGYAISRGQVSLKNETVLSEGFFEAENQLTLNHVEVRRDNDRQAERTDERLSMPLNLVLSLLEDNQQRIQFDVPVSGELNSPTFDIATLVTQATRKALTKTATNYLKYAVQPFGLLFLAADAAGHVMRPSFEPVHFEPGGLNLSDEERAQLNTIATLLTERPNLSLQICGTAIPGEPAPSQQTGAVKDQQPTPTDPKAAATQAQLLDMASLRADAVRAHLQERGIAEERLHGCEPRVLASEQSQPRVEIKL